MAEVLSSLVSVRGGSEVHSGIKLNMNGAVSFTHSSLTHEFWVLLASVLFCLFPLGQLVFSVSYTPVF